MAPREPGDDKADPPTERERGFATLDKLRYVLWLFQDDIDIGKY